MVARAMYQEGRERLGIRYVTGETPRLNEYIANNRFDLVTSCLAPQDMPGQPMMGDWRRVNGAQASASRKP
jgi:hypothetical protein